MNSELKFYKIYYTPQNGEKECMKESDDDYYYNLKEAELYFEYLIRAIKPRGNVKKITLELCIVDNEVEKTIISFQRLKEEKNDFTIYQVQNNGKIYSSLMPEDMLSFGCIEDAEAYFEHKFRYMRTFGNGSVCLEMMEEGEGKIRTISRYSRRLKKI